MRSRFLKRLIDEALASLGLALASPVLLGMAVAIRASLGSPVLFRQLYMGYRSRPFLILMFRPMRDAVDPDRPPTA